MEFPLWYGWWCSVSHFMSFPFTLSGEPSVGFSINQVCLRRQCCDFSLVSFLWNCLCFMDVLWSEEMVKIWSIACLWSYGFRVFGCLILLDMIWFLGERVVWSGEFVSSSGDGVCDEPSFQLLSELVVASLWFTWIWSFLMVLELSTAYCCCVRGWGFYSQWCFVMFCFWFVISL